MEEMIRKEFGNKYDRSEKGYVTYFRVERSFNGEIMNKRDFDNYEDALVCFIRTVRVIGEDEYLELVGLSHLENEFNYYNKIGPKYKMRDNEEAYLATKEVKPGYVADIYCVLFYDKARLLRNKEENDRLRKEFINK